MTKQRSEKSSTAHLTGSLTTTSSGESDKPKIARVMVEESPSALSKITTKEGLQHEKDSQLPGELHHVRAA